MVKTLRSNLCAALLACAALGANAEPLSYTSTQSSTDAVAVAGAIADVASATSPPDTLPLVSTAVATSGADFASGAGLAGSGLLVAQSEASSVGDATSATGTALFEGMFSMGAAGQLQFSIDLLDQDFTDAGQFSDASLFFTLSFGGKTFADLVLTGDSAPFFLQVDLPGAGTGMFSLLLTSESSAMRGSASNFAQAEYRVAAVPEPSTMALMLGGGLMGWIVRRRRGAKGLTIV